MGWVYSLIALAMGAEDVQFPPRVLMVFAGALVGVLFGSSVRIIYLLNERRIPYGFVTVLTMGICIPLYFVSLYLAMKYRRPDIAVGTVMASSGIVLFTLVMVESCRTKPAVIKVPEVYGFFVGAFLGVAEIVIGVVWQGLLGRGEMVESGFELTTAVILASGGACVGMLFGLGIRLIYRMSGREIPYGLVTAVTLVICLPLYTFSIYYELVRGGIFAFWATVASPLIVLTVLGMREWWRVRAMRRGLVEG